MNDEQAWPTYGSPAESVFVQIHVLVNFFCIVLRIPEIPGFRVSSHTLATQVFSMNCLITSSSRHILRYYLKIGKAATVHSLLSYEKLIP
jgi:hypothetical protein